MLTRAPADGKSFFFVTVPTLGFGISPLGPNIFPNLPTSAIMSGEEIIKSTNKIDNDIQVIDNDFIHAMEAGMPPVGGVGIGYLILKSLLRKYKGEMNFF